jgi:integrase/recombinase XerD
VSEKQLELFPFASSETLSLLPKPSLERTASLRESLVPFTEYMEQKEFTENTIKAFLNDIKLFADFVGPETPLGECSPHKLEQFLHYLQFERKVPCSPKSLDRRITTLKVFFGWLAHHDVVAADPSAPLVHQATGSRSPTILNDAQIRATLSVTKSMRDAPDAPDARPHLLVTLLISSGIKKAECIRLTLEHIDLSNPQKPTIYIHYDKPRQRFKARRLALPAEWAETLPRYLRRYQPREQLFECTPRNLEYVLHSVSTLAHVPHKLTFEMLRWTSAVTSFKAGMDKERLRKRLGLSQISWRETLPIIHRLAEEPL